MTAPSTEITAAVRQRAGQRCEYCRMHQALQGGTFHIEHTTPKSRGGLSDFDNLAFACISCNLRKSDRIEAIDPATGAVVPLFNPRVHVWADHFSWSEFEIDGKSPTGRATIGALDFNSERRIFIRQAEALLALFPP